MAERKTMDGRKFEDETEGKRNTRSMVRLPRSSLVASEVTGMRRSYGRLSENMERWVQDSTQFERMLNNVWCGDWRLRVNLQDMSVNYPPLHNAPTERNYRPLPVIAPTVYPHAQNRRTFAEAVTDDFGSRASMILVGTSETYDKLMNVKAFKEVKGNSCCKAEPDDSLKRHEPERSHALGNLKVTRDNVPGEENLESVNLEDPLNDNPVGPMKDLGSPNIDQTQWLKSKSIDLNKNPGGSTSGESRTSVRKDNDDLSTPDLSTDSVNKLGSESPLVSLNSTQEIDATVELGEKIGFCFEGKKEQPRMLLQRRGATEHHQ
ncbi:hypothetical protein L2E82_38559 [Cichorium intybus]|uniref:Uncharacterized protein n=1 Tax=Cichorium intybus TaxID=13427 RepID=A0ACB9AGS5_CICIN|nr:hypothetical protein L2E82_38559 [Cichorium intybus]